MERGRVSCEAVLVNPKAQSEQGVILLAEDCEDDIALVEQGFARARIRNRLQIVRNGDEALGYLQGEGKFAQREQFPLPDLLLLDLRMPLRDGFEVLQWIRRDPTHKLLRVVVLTSSSDIRDINRAYRLGANSFLVKPTDFQDYPALSKAVTEFWFGDSIAPRFAEAGAR